MTAEEYQGLPAVSAERMRVLDQLATEKHGLPVLQLMENAGRAVAAETERYMKIAGAEVVVCCGRGANGGDGLVAARILKEKGGRVSVFLCPPRDSYPEPVRVNLERARAAGVDVTSAGPESGLGGKLKKAALALDALLGTGSKGGPSGAVFHMIEELNGSGKPVLAVDIPSGLDCDTGEREGACVLAAETLTLGLPKRGLLAPQAKKYVGELKVLDIGYPPEILRG